MSDTNKQAANTMRARRVRNQISGTAERPRLSVRISNRNITAQIIDDAAGSTLAAVDGSTLKLSTRAQQAEEVGKSIAVKAKQAKVKQVVFDRGAKRYHGQLKVVADAARKSGLEF